LFLINDTALDQELAQWFIRSPFKISHALLESKMPCKSYAHSFLEPDTIAALFNGVGEKDPAFEDQFIRGSAIQRIFHDRGRDRQPAAGIIFFGKLRRDPGGKVPELFE